MDTDKKKKDGKFSMHFTKTLHCDNFSESQNLWVISITQHNNGNQQRHEGFAICTKIQTLKNIAKQKRLKINKIEEQTKLRSDRENEQPGDRNCGTHRGGSSGPCPPSGTECCC